MSTARRLLLAILLPGCAGAPAPAPVLALDEVGLRSLLANPGERPLLVEFFASWCSACRGELAEVQALAHAEPGLDLALVSLDEASTEPSRLQDYAVSNGVTQPLYHLTDADPVAALRDVVPGFPGAIPWTLAVEPGGAIRASHAGRLDQEARGRLLGSR